MALTRSIRVRALTFDRSPGSTSEDFDVAVLVGTITWIDDVTGDAITRDATKLVPLTATQVTQVHNFLANLVSQVKLAD